MISQHHGLLVDEINASRITNTSKCINASSFNILLQGCSCTKQCMDIQFDLPNLQRQ
jgi:hypothetical protein